MQSLQVMKAERKSKQNREKENQRLLEEYYDTLLQLRQLRAAFQQVCRQASRREGQMCRQRHALHFDWPK